MKNLKAQIEADIKSHAVFACHNLQASVAAIDFVALSLSQDHQEQGYGVDGTTAVINVRGLLVPQMSRDRSNWGITAYNQIARYLARANSDPFIDGIRLDIDSGGGYVAGLDDVVEQIANLDKPITTFVSGDMYSAAYWLGVSTEKITAKKSSGIGSIGVFVVHSESSKGLEKQGDTLSIFRSGKWKGAFNWFSPLAKYEKDRLQQGVDDTASLFFNHVARQRKLTAQQVKDWQGDVFTAQQAKECGLIDAIVGKSTTTANHVKQHKQQTAQQTAVAFNTGLASLTQNPKETTMELPQALAALDEKDKRISELQRQVVQKDSLATTAMRERDDAGKLHHYRGQHHAYDGKDNLIGDWESGKIYALRSDVFTDDGQPVYRERTLPFFPSEKKQVSYLRLELEMSVNNADEPTNESTIQLQWSDDYARTWHPPMSHRLGRKDTDLTRIVWRRLGVGRQRTYRFSTVANIRCALINAFVDVQGADR